MKKFTILFIILCIILGYSLVKSPGCYANGAALATAPPVAAVPGPLKVQFYNGNVSPTSNMIYLHIIITNTGTTPLVLSDIKIRYYFTINGVKPLNFMCYYSPQVSVSNVTGTFVTMTTPVIGADHYFEIGFTPAAGTLAPGASVELFICVYKSDWSNFNQLDDYSFNPTAANFINWSKVTGYISGTLKWGVEP